MDTTILFQLTFTFIYRTLTKKFQFQQNKQISNKPLIMGKKFEGNTIQLTNKKMSYADVITHPHNKL